MARNPFHYGTPVEGDQFTGREQELAALVAPMRDGINVVLLSPRRDGKTSLLLRAESELAVLRPAGAVVKANVLRARDLAALAGQLAAGIYPCRGRAGIGPVRRCPSISAGCDCGQLSR